jgi:hypothetical protein
MVTEDTKFGTSAATKRYTAGIIVGLRMGKLFFETSKRHRYPQVELNDSSAMSSSSAKEVRQMNGTLGKSVLKDSGTIPLAHPTSSHRRSTLFNL